MTNNLNNDILKDNNKIIILNNDYKKIVEYILKNRKKEYHLKDIVYMKYNKYIEICIMILNKYKIKYTIDIIQGYNSLDVYNYFKEFKNLSINHIKKQFDNKNNMSYNGSTSTYVNKYGNTYNYKIIKIFYNEHTAINIKNNSIIIFNGYYEAEKYYNNTEEGEIIEDIEEYILNNKNKRSIIISTIDILIEYISNNNISLLSSYDIIFFNSLDNLIEIGYVSIFCHLSSDIIIYSYDINNYSLLFNSHYTSYFKPNFGYIKNTENNHKFYLELKVFLKHYQLDGNCSYSYHLNKNIKDLEDFKIYSKYIVKYDIPFTVISKLFEIDLDLYNINDIISYKNTIDEDKIYGKNKVEYIICHYEEFKDYKEECNTINSIKYIKYKIIEVLKCYNEIIVDSNKKYTDKTINLYKMAGMDIDRRQT